MNKVFVPALALLAACGKQEEPAPPVPAIPATSATGLYAMTLMEDVQPVVSLNLTSTPGLDWSVTLNSDALFLNPSGTGRIPQQTPTLISRAATDTLTITIRIPRIPFRVNQGANILFDYFQFDGKNKLNAVTAGPTDLAISSNELANPANYGPTGYVKTLVYVRRP